MEEDEETLEALNHLGQGPLSLLASLQPGVDLVVPGEELGDGEEEGEAGGGRHAMKVGRDLGDQQAGDTQEVEEHPAKHEDELERKIYFCQDLSLHLPDIENSEDSIEQEDPPPAAPAPHGYFLEIS